MLYIFSISEIYKLYFMKIYGPMVFSLSISPLDFFMKLNGDVLKRVVLILEFDPPSATHSRKQN